MTTIMVCGPTAATKNSAVFIKKRSKKTVLNLVLTGCLVLIVGVIVIPLVLTILDGFLGFFGGGPGW